MDAALHCTHVPSAAILIAERWRRGPRDCLAAQNELHSLSLSCSFVWPRDRRVYCDLAGDEGVAMPPSHAARAHTRGFLRHENANFLTDTWMRRTSVRVINSERRAAA